MNCQNLKQKYEELLNLQNEFQILNAEFQKMKPSTVAERRAVSDELLRKQVAIEKFIQENFDSILWQEKIIKSEKKFLEEFFGQTIDIPKLPKEITKEKIANWEKIGFKLRYLPDMDMSQDKEYKGWKNKPEDWFYNKIKEGDISGDSHILKAGWVLVDEINKPNYNIGNQTYENDPLGPAIKELREKGVIDNFKILDSRFNFKGSDLDKKEVKEAFAKILNVNLDQISLPRAIEFNTLGNMHYPKWGKTDTWEWFQDLGQKDLSGRRLDGGGSDHGGLSFVSCFPLGDRGGFLTFRPLIRLS